VPMNRCSDWNTPRLGGIAAWAGKLLLSISLLLSAAASATDQTVSASQVPSTCAEVKPGVIVETVSRNSEAEKAGLAEGDVILAWARGDVKGEIRSPFDLSKIEIEQKPRGQVTLSGLRGSVTQAWTMGAERWGLVTDPNLNEPKQAILREGQELAKANKLAEAVGRWRTAAAGVEDSSCAWVAVWFLYHSAFQFADAKRWKDSDQLYEEAVTSSANADPAVRTILFLTWASRYWQRLDLQQYGTMNQRALDESLKLSDENLAMAAALNGLGISAMSSGDLHKGAEYYRKALAMREKLAPGSLDVGMSLNNLGEIARKTGDLALAKQYYSQALAIQENVVPDTLSTTIPLNNLGVIARQMGDFAEAESYSKRALAIDNRLSPQSLETSSALNSLGNLSLLRGDIQGSERYLLESLAILKILGTENVFNATVLMNLGNVYHARGELTLADQSYQQALAIEQKLAPQSVDIAMTFTHLGMDARERGDIAEAENYFEQNLQLMQKLAPEGLDVANGFDNLANLALSRGKLQEAEELCRKALAIEQKVAPHALVNGNDLEFLGEQAFELGDVATAENYNRRARDLFEELAPESEEYAGSIAFQAVLAERNGKREEATQLYAQALDVLDRQLTHLGGSNDVRAGFRGKHAYYYAEYVNLLVDQKKPDLAFSVLERSRARTLLEMLASSHVDIQRGADPELIDKERLLQATLTAKTNRKVSLLEGEHTAEQLAEVNREMDTALSEYQGLESQIRANSPRYAALTQPKPLSAQQAQRLLDADTILLDYSLGAKRSLLFLLTPTALDAYALPKRDDIEKAARHTYDLLTARNHSVEGETTLQRKARLAIENAEYREAAATLSQMVLGPVAGKLGGKRLLIAADGALQYVPFGALPVPKRDASEASVPLVAEHEIVNLASASVLAFLREHGQEQSSRPAKQVAVLADPVFDKEDQRVGKTQAANSTQNKDGAADNISESAEHLTRSIQDVRSGAGPAEVGLPRLAFSRREAAAIMAVTKPWEGMEALDFRASRETALSRELGDYRILHFATHGLLDNEHPELSGLVFSLVNAEGKPENGFVDLEDIYNLTLSSDLVVLSACETGLGKNISGEGLVGLTRGFMYAGAPRVVASLWKVDDVATSELMAEFYKGMLQEGLPAAAALRRAQLEMQKRKRWADPYYWAAFTLQGEWK